MLMNEKALKDRIYDVYYQMKTRARPKLWKSGARRGSIRKPGLSELPFTREQLWKLALEQVGEGLVNCPYCAACGRVGLISLENFAFDHRIPLQLGGSWSLDNLIAVCKDCNNIKGYMTYEAFIRLMQIILTFHKADGDYIIKCLRTHGIAQQFQRFKSNAKVSLPLPEQQNLLAPEF